jgi:hypothetical protein
VNEKSPGARAVEKFQIQDVFLVSSECWVARDFNNLAPIQEFAVGHTTGVDSEALIQARAPATGGQEIYILRYFVNAEVQLLKPGIQPSKERVAGKEEILAFLKFTIAADYLCPKESIGDKDAIGAFSRNAHFHAWPYFREEVHAMCCRLRVPRVTLPMLRPDQLRATTDIQSIQKLG